MTPAHTIRSALNDTLEAQAIGDAEAKRLFNPDSEVNSLAERLVALRRHGVPQAELRAIFADLRAVIDLNAQQCNREADVAGQLDELAAILHRAETEAHVESALGIKSLARALRPALDTIATPAHHSAFEYVRCLRDVDRIIATTPRKRLLSIGLRHELGSPTKYALLVDLVEAADEATA